MGCPAITTCVMATTECECVTIIMIIVMIPTQFESTGGTTGIIFLLQARPSSVTPPPPPPLDVRVGGCLGGSEGGWVGEPKSQGGQFTPPPQYR